MADNAGVVDIHAVVLWEDHEASNAPQSHRPNAPVETNLKDDHRR
jgi:hypothetical protein